VRVDRVRRKQHHRAGAANRFEVDPSAGDAQLGVQIGRGDDQPVGAVLIDVPEVLE